MTSVIETICESRGLRLGSAVALALVLCAGAAAQDTAPPDPPPTLDDLLGIDEADDQGDETADRERREALDTLLSEEEVVEGFEAAIARMALSAELLDAQLDAGLGTQRVQEDILAKLDALIADAQRKSRNQSSSSSSSSTRRSSDQSQKPPSKGKPQPGETQPSPNPSDSNESADPPGRQDGPLNNIIDETRIEWGSLPERVRGMIQQGLRDRASSLYRQLTEEYYRRIADEVSS